MFGMTWNRYSAFILIAFAVLAYLSAAETLARVMPLALWAGLGLGVAIASVFAVGLCVTHYQRTKTRISELIRDRQLAELQADAEQFRIDANRDLADAALDQIRAGVIYPSDLTANKFSHIPSAKIQPPDTLLLEDGVSDKSDKLDFETIARKGLSSRGAGRFIVFGGQDSGKTTLAKHIVNYATEEIIRVQGGQVFIIDPHAPETVWGDGLKVVGAGMDYESIANFLDYVVADVKARYQAGCGDDSQPLPPPYKPNFIVCEEWTGVIEELQDMKRWGKIHNKMLYKDSRKAGWGYLLIAHEHTAAALGLQGMMNLLKGVEYFITLEKNALIGQHTALIGKSFKDKNPYELITPGPYNGRMVYSPAQAESERTRTDKYLIIEPPKESYTIDLSGLVKPEPDSYEMKVCQAYKDILETVRPSCNAMHKTITGGAINVNSRQREKYRSILQKYGIAPQYF